MDADHPANGVPIPRLSTSWRLHVRTQAMTAALVNASDPGAADSASSRWTKVFLTPADRCRPVRRWKSTRTPTCRSGGEVLAISSRRASSKASPRPTQAPIASRVVSRTRRIGESWRLRTHRSSRCAVRFARRRDCRRQGPVEDPRQLYPDALPGSLDVDGRLLEQIGHWRGDQGVAEGAGRIP